VIQVWGRATLEPGRCRVLPCYATTSAPAGAVSLAEALRWRRWGTGKTAGLSGDSPSSLQSSLYGRLQLGYARCRARVDPPVLPVRIALPVELPAQVLDLVLKARGVAVVLVTRLSRSVACRVGRGAEVHDKLHVGGVRLHNSRPLAGPEKATSLVSRGMGYPSRMFLCSSGLISPHSA
jgi:hypothetical protein